MMTKGLGKPVLKNVLPLTPKQASNMTEQPSSDMDLMLDKVRISLDGKTLIDLSFSVAAGEIVTIMGPSGSGKSTLLSFLGGFLTSEFQTEGRILLEGNDVTHLPAEKRRIGILFQDPLLFPHMSVGDNLSFGLRSPLRGAKRRVRIEQALDNIDMAGFADRDPATLSGGQKARVALARILLSKPCALLLDEPFSKLDANLRQQMRQWVFDKARKRALPTLLVTHDEDDAIAAGGRVIRLDAQGITGCSQKGLP